MNRVINGLNLFNSLKAVNVGNAPKADALAFSPATPGLSVSQDQFVKSKSHRETIKFGNTAPEPQAPVNPAQVVAEIIAAVQDLPGSKPLIDLLNQWINGEPWPEPDWKRMEKDFGQAQVDDVRTRWTQKPWQMLPGADDMELLQQVYEQLEHMVHVSEIAPQTLMVAYEKGLAKLFDQALERHVVPESQAVGGIIWSSSSEHNPNHIEPFHIGRMGSDALLPLLEKFLQTDDPEKLESVFGALTWMESNPNPKISIQATKLRDKYRQKAEYVLLNKLEKYIMGTDALLQLGQIGKTFDSAAAFARAWDATNNYREHLSPRELEGRDEASINREIRETREYILTGWMDLISRGVPGAAEALASRKSEIKNALLEIRQNERGFDIRAVRSEKAEIMENGLLAESLSELPSRTPPEGYNDASGRKPWPYAKDDLGYFMPFIRMTQAMAGRGVAGAKEMNEELLEKLDDYLIEILKQITDGIPEGGRSYFYSDYNAKSIFETMAMYSSPKVIPSLQKLIETPWHPTIRWGNWSSGGEQYTTDITLIAQNKTIPLIQRTIEKIKYRTGQGHN